MQADLESLHFGNYLALVRSYCPAVQGMLAFDRDLNLLWQHGVTAPEIETAESRLANFRRGDCEELMISLEDHDWIEFAKLRNRDFEIVLTLCFCIEGEERRKPGSVATMAQIPLLNEMLVAEYEQSLALASREDELNHMTDELTRRYEELNLIYKAEDQAVNIYHGRGLLHQLVANTARFLNVDIIYLYIDNKNVAMHRFRDDEPVYGADALFQCLRERVQPILETERRAIVINHLEESRHHGIDEPLPFKMVVSPVVNAEGGVIGSLTIASQNFAIDFSNSDRNLLDVMAKKASKIAQSHFDPLTGLENSNSFELILKDALKNTRGLEVQHAIANIDIDRMAVINDISGRDAGDLLIKKVARTLSDAVRSRDVVARLGSDKFGILLENCDLGTAKSVMKKLSHAVSSIDMEWEGRKHEVSVSIGVVPVTARSQSVTSLLNAAETARNVSKERGRNAIHVLDVEDSDLLNRKEQIRWVSRIQQALRDDRFVLYAQQIQPLKPDTAKPHYEILLRMLDEDGSTIAPGEFIPAAEKFYLMSSIDHWVIDRALSELAETNRGSKRGCQVSINLSGQSLNDPVGFSAYIENKLEHYGIDPRDICFEITESAAIAHIEDACTFIDQVHKLGCRFSLDDFGTGLSSFAYLKNLKVDYLKIDGGFVRDILRDPVSESMVGAINQVGQAMKLRTVAEFVENDTIKHKLARIGVDYGQGYAIGKPTLFRELELEAAKTA